MLKEWNGKRYHSLNYFLRNKFGEKVFKISLDGGFSCPNRDGTISKGGCVFCSERGSGDFAGNRCTSIHKQFEDIKIMMNKKWKNGKYIAYFQAYTNTYAPVEVLREKYYEALKEEDVVALAIATRPDCLPDEVLDLLEEICEDDIIREERDMDLFEEDILDSLGFAELLTRIEEETGVIISPSEVVRDDINTVNKILELVKSKKQG